MIGEKRHKYKEIVDIDLQHTIGKSDSVISVKQVQ